MELQKQNQIILAASMDVSIRGDKTWRQAKYILDLLQNSINNKAPVTRNDIVKCYVDFKFHGKDIITKSKWDCWDRKWFIVEYDKSDFTKQLWPPDAIAWFKNNLGSAILKGKILAIPVINL